MDWTKVPRAKRRFLRKHPRPEQPPEGFTTHNHPDRPGETLLISAEDMQEVFQAEMDGYDDAPQAVRDWMKEHKHWPN